MEVILQELKSPIENFENLQLRTPIMQKSIMKENTIYKNLGISKNKVDIRTATKTNYSSQVTR